MQKRQEISYVWWNLYKEIILNSWPIAGNRLLWFLDYLKLSITEAGNIDLNVENVTRALSYQSRHIEEKPCQIPF